MGKTCDTIDNEGQCKFLCEWKDNACKEKAPLYVIAQDVSSLTCPGGYEAIASEFTCRTAATYLNETFKRSLDNDDYPPGCYLDIGFKELYYNLDKEGRTSSNRAIVCKQATPRPTHLPTPAPTKATPRP